jgi:1-acyl-sn-glycerol-3-phosphate acyltransferase
MGLVYWAVTGAVKQTTRLLCRVHDQELERIPKQGPLILVSNHINFLDVPIMYTHLMPRPATAFTKVETWDNPLLGLLAELWKAIPIRRGEPDLNALRQGVQALRAGGILAVSPEGTRSGDGRLQRGHPGVVMIAQMSGSPLLPVVFYGNEQFQANLRRLRRTDFQIVVGRMFRLKDSAMRLGREARQRATDEIMVQLAALLPPPYRGAYADTDAAKMNYLEYF